MSSDRLLSIFEKIAEHERSGGEEGLLCAVAAEITKADGAGIALSTDDSTSMITYCASGDMARSFVDLEVTVGEGPCLRAVETDALVNCEDLSTLSDDWTLYAPEASAQGARSVTAVPVRIGAIRIGAMCLYNTEPGDLSDEQSSDAHLMASVVGRAVVAMQAGAPRDTLSEQLQNEASFDFSVHQAAGMVAVQASVSISNALQSLRMHAYALSETITSVSGRIVARQLSFDGDSQEWIES